MFQMPYLPKTLSPTNFRITVVRSEMMAGSFSGLMRKWESRVSDQTLFKTVCASLPRNLISEPAFAMAVVRQHKTKF